MKFRANHHSLMGLLITITLFFTSINYANAQYLEDQANVIEPNFVQQYNTVLSDLETKQDLLVHVVIVPSFANQDAVDTINKSIDKLTQSTSKASQRILLFISLDTPYASIHPSTNLVSVYPKIVQDEIASKIKSNIANKQYSQMLKDSLGSVVQYYDQSKPKKPTRSLMDIALDNIVLIVLFVLFFVALKFKGKLTHRREI